ncbi:MAG: terminase gpA endonuclease subunit, partial [Thiohalocapsa sp.]
AAALSSHNSDDAVYREQERLVFAPYPSEDRLQLHVSAISIDSSDGNTNDAVYHWVQTRSRQHRGVQIMASKGASVDREI